MVLFLKIIYKYYYDLMQNYADPRTENFFLAQNPLIPIAIVAVYLQFVKVWGPNFMKNRPAYNLNKVLAVYNIVQIVLSFRLFYLGSIHAYIFGPYHYICEPVDYSDDPLALLVTREVHNYYLLKVLDLLDTVFFVLRKKERQISFLHIYHHSAMVMAVWVGVRFIAGGHVLFLGLINTLVHTVMYTYYLVAIFDDSSRIWWKKYITLLQIFQFGMVVLQWTLMVLGPSCGFPKSLALIFIPQNIFMAVMFLDFYYKTYVKKK